MYRPGSGLLYLVAADSMALYSFSSTQCEAVRYSRWGGVIQGGGSFRVNKIGTNRKLLQLINLLL